MRQASFIPSCQAVKRATICLFLTQCRNVPFPHPILSRQGNGKNIISLVLINYRRIIKENPGVEAILVSQRAFAKWGWGWGEEYPCQTDNEPTNQTHLLFFFE